MKTLRALNVLLFWIISPILFIFYGKGLNIFNIKGVVYYIKYGKLKQPYFDIYYTIKSKFNRP